MEIRNATIADVALCERIEPIFRTSHVWKVEHRADENGFGITFSRARLPQEMPVEAPYEVGSLFGLWQRHRCFLVAEDKGLVLGYLIMQPRGPKDEGWVSHLLVATPFEGRGVAAKLLEGAEAWGRENRLSSITVAVQTRNDPLIQLLPKRGYSFRGFVEGYFGGSEAALLFSLALARARQ